MNFKLFSTVKCHSPKRVILLSPRKFSFVSQLLYISNITQAASTGHAKVLEAFCQGNALVLSSATTFLEAVSV